MLPERVQEALGQLVGAAKEGLLALSVGVGLGVLSSMLEEEVDEVVGPRGKWNPERTAVRHGHDDGEVTLKPGPLPTAGRDHRLPRRALIMPTSVGPDPPTTTGFRNPSRHKVHKERNVIRHLAERDRLPVLARMRRAWADTDYERAREQLTRLASELEHTHPGAAGSRREGLEDTLTVIRLGIKGKLKRTSESTNPSESTLDSVRATQRNVKHWSSGEMGLRWTAAGMLEAEKHFRKVIGYTQLPALAVAIERRLHLQPTQSTSKPEAAIAVTM